MGRKSNHKYPEDGFPDLKTGIQKWEIVAIVCGLSLIGVLIYMGLNL